MLSASSIKTLFILFCAVIIMTGCGKDRSTEKKKTQLTLAVQVSAESRRLYRKVIADFESEHPDIKVDLMEIPGQYYSKLMVMLAGGNPPDLMWMGQSFSEFATKGVFLDIKNRLGHEIKQDEFIPEVIKWYKFGDKIYGIALTIDTDFIVYNKSLFDKCGVPYPKDDWNLNEFIATAKKLTIDKNRDGITDQYGFKGTLDFSSFGAQIISEDGKRPLCDSVEMLDYLQTTRNMWKKWKISPPPDSQDGVGLDIYSYFRQGKAAMMRMYTWNIPFLESKCADIQWDIVEPPTVKKKAHWASSQAILISAETRHPEAAWLLFKKFLSPEVQTFMASSGLPSRKSVAAKVAAQRRKQHSYHYDAIFNARKHLYPYPHIANLDEMMTLFGSGVSAVNLGFLSPEAAMKKAVREMRINIKRNARRNRRDPER